MSDRHEMRRTAGVVSVGLGLVAAVLGVYAIIDLALGGSPTTLLAVASALAVTTVAFPPLVGWIERAIHAPPRAASPSSDTEGR